MKVYITALFILLSIQGFSQQLRVINLLCERKKDPAGIESVTPLFSWQAVTPHRGYMQSAYQIQVSEDSVSFNGGATPRITSQQSNMVPYTGRKLLPGRRYYWRVQVWDQLQRSSGWSAVATFTTGLYTKADWSNAQWIGYEDMPDSMRLVPGVHKGEEKFYEMHKARKRTVVPLFRKDFKISRRIKSAYVFISGLGQYELNLNGKKAGDNFLAPGWTYYDKRALYNTYDVTHLLTQGDNTIGVIVGNGFYNINKERYHKLSVAFGMPQMICKLQITYFDGSINDIVSDSRWKTTASPITYAGIFGGEDYDAGLEQKNWDRPGFNDSSWKQAKIVKAPLGGLQAETDYPVKVMEVIPVKTITHPADSIYMYDFGQNASGIVELKVKGRKGQTVRLTPAELLSKELTANQKATGKPYYFSYTLKGDGEETWRPRFTYYGFRYVQVEGAVPDTVPNRRNLPQITGLSMLHTRNSTPENGSFECSSPLFNQIDTLIRWAIKSNMQSVVTDCPHREKLSWLEQDHLMGASIQFNYDIYNLYKKLVYDMMDAQTKEGLVPDIAPEFVFFNDKGFGFRDSPEWGSASVILPWLLYQWYGEKEIMRQAYPMMKKYVEYLQRRSVNHILSYGLGDWYDYGPKHPGVAQLTPIPLTATAIYYYDLNLLAGMAILLGHTQDAAVWSKLAGEVKQAFNKKFLNPATKVYATGSQTAMAMPLCTGLVEEKYQRAVFRNLVDAINRNGKKLTAGDIGFHYLVRALQEGGASQLIYNMNSRSDVPGYGFQLARGATALTESWPALPGVSNNHLMLGHIMEWFYNGLGGISQDKQSVGYRNIIIRPEIVGDITAVKTSYNTVYGTIRSEWEKQDDRLLFHIVIPPNSFGIVKLPATKEQAITESNTPLNKQKDVVLLNYEDGRAIIKAGAGDYRFEVK